ncbi:hypothetical protein HYU13_02845 [Candidatus Woesearchaeota archaeon]|nr:hypothetical protein [Candidatus Woesearchaeota archaeon]
MSGKNKACGFCKYEWISRVAAPKSCPRCKRRFDYKDAQEVLGALRGQFGYRLQWGKSWQKI